MNTIFSSNSNNPAEPFAWARIAEEYQAGIVARGKVVVVRPRYVLVELLPGARAILHVSELDGTRVRPEDVVTVGDRIAVRILSLDASARRAELSLRQAHGEPPLPPIADAEGCVFLAGEIARARHGEGPSACRVSRPTQKHEERDVESRQLQARRRKRARRRRIGRRGPRLLPSIDRDPVASEQAFLDAIEEKLSACDVGHRPAPVRLHPEFLPSARTLIQDSVLSPARIVEACALVASGLPCNALHKHPLRAGAGPNEPQLTREHDGATAWRGYLQNGAPAAGRLHWWEVRTPEGKRIEFARACKHEDFDIAA